MSIEDKPPPGAPWYALVRWPVRVATLLIVVGGLGPPWPWQAITGDALGAAIVAAGFVACAGFVWVAWRGSALNTDRMGPVEAIAVWAGVAAFALCVIGRWAGVGPLALPVR